MRVISYNILCSELSDPIRNNHCDPKFLDSPHRLELLKQKLQVEIDRGSILCLQEVSTMWEGELQPFFQQQGYAFITSMYGHRKNGYMGIGIAYSLSTYTLMEYHNKRISDTVGLLTPKEELPSYWELALNRMNRMILLKLQNKIQSEETFWISNYHMPCMFDHIDVMLIHTTLVAQYIQQIADDTPYILTGDFNSIPTSPMYQLLTTGYYRHLTDNGKEDSYQFLFPYQCCPMRSVYYEKNKVEPDFTNCSQINNEPLFHETIDYIFVSKTWNICRVDSLLKYSIELNPLPNETESSDHILIAAELYIS